MKIRKENPENLTGVLLLNRHLTVSAAESCSGGLISDLITNVAGSSGYFKGSVVAYSNEIKEKMLGVPAGVIKKFGAVSRETAVLMAIGARKICRSDIGVSTTGIAGPGGGTKKKPVGLVYVAVADKNHSAAHKFNFSGTRAQIKRKTALMALDILRKFIIKLPRMHTKK